MTTFVEKKLSFCVRKLRNFMRVYVNSLIGRGRFEIYEFSAGIPVISNAEIFSLLLLHVLACSNYA